MHLCLFEDAGVHHLEPLTLTRHAADLRIGMHTVAEMHRRAFRPATLCFHARPLVADLTRQEHPDDLVGRATGRPSLLVNARYVPEPGDVLDRLKAAAGGDRSARLFRQGNDAIAAWMPDPPDGLFQAETLSLPELEGVPEEQVQGARMIARLWDLVADVARRLIDDFTLTDSRGDGGAVVQDGAVVAGSDYHLGRGAVIKPGAVINALDAPVWIGEGAVIEENAVVQGPCYIGPHATIKATARIDGSAIGHRSKVGGEVHGSVIHSLSGKPHDGYLGNSYLGRWCNLGADTNTSNLKNDYGEVTMYDAVAGDFVGTGRQFLGLIMGDHSKCSINSMFNTGTVVGVFCNLFGAGFPPRHIPSFSWGGADGLTEYRLDKAYRVAEAVMARRDIQPSQADRANLAAIFEATADQRAG